MLDREAEGLPRRPEELPRLTAVTDADVPELEQVAWMAAGRLARWESSPLEADQAVA